MTMNARLHDRDLYDAAANWHQIDFDVQSLVNLSEQEQERTRRGLSGRMYRAGIDIPLLIAEVMRLRQYVPKDKRYPNEQ